METNKRDLIIIGGGAAGLNIASVASQLGLKVTLIEKAPALGGDCLHTGCVPSKTLLNSAKCAWLINHAELFGLKNLDYKPDFAQVMQHVQSVIAKIQVHDDPKRFENYGCEVIFGEAVFNSVNSVQVNNNIIKAKRIVIATGSKPFIPPIDGLKQIEYLTNETVFSLKQLPQNLLIVGAGPIGIELAQAFTRLGSKVTVVETSSQILPFLDNTTAVKLQSHLASEGVDFKLDSTVLRLSKQQNGITATIRHNALAEDFDFTDILIATGRSADIYSLELSKANISFDQHGIVVNDKLQTSNKKVYALGDAINCPYKFTHIAEYHAQLVITNLLFNMRAKQNYNLVPSVIYTSLECATIGLTEQKAQQLGKKYQLLSYDYKDLDRAICDGTTFGHVRVLVAKNKIIGATILGVHAGELIHELALLMKTKQSIKHLSALIHAYPTYAQINRRVINQYYAPILFSKKTRALIKIFNFFRR